MNWRVIEAASLIFIGCCMNVLTLELLLKHDKGSGDVVTFSQFLFISLVGFLQRIDYSHFPQLKIIPRVVPITRYSLYAVLFSTVSVLNNKSLGYHIALPFHMIFRSGSLITSLLFGAIFLKRRYSLVQILSVLAVTIGIFLATTASNGEFTVGTDSSKFFTGITMLSVALIVSSIMGIFQESLFSKYGKGLNQEQQFYSHLLSLPYFAPMILDITRKFSSWSTLALFEFELFSSVVIKIPMMYVYLFGNVITQYICISGVFMMTGAAGALSMTLTITLRKFVSLLLSIWIFSNPFTYKHWIATILIFSGTLIYSWPRNKNPQSQANKDKEIKKD